MGQWGTGPTEANTRPNWVSTAPDATSISRPNHPMDNINIFVTDEGWVREYTYIDAQGNSRVKKEVLVADGNLATKINDTTGELYVVDVRWEVELPDDFMVPSGFSFIPVFSVIFNQPVTFTTPPQWAILNGSNQLGDYVSGDTTNKLVFDLPVVEASPGGTLVPVDLLFGTIDAYDPITKIARVPALSITTGQQAAEHFIQPSGIQPLTII